MRAYSYSPYVVNYLSLLIGLNTINSQGAESRDQHCPCPGVRGDGAPAQSIEEGHVPRQGAAVRVRDDAV